MPVAVSLRTLKQTQRGCFTSFLLPHVQGGAQAGKEEEEEEGRRKAEPGFGCSLPGGDNTWWGRGGREVLSNTSTGIYYLF